MRSLVLVPCLVNQTLALASQRRSPDPAFGPWLFRGKPPSIYKEGSLDGIPAIQGHQKPALPWPEIGCFWSLKIVGFHLKAECQFY
jgi:hypothetical protein